MGFATHPGIDPVNLTLDGIQDYSTVGTLPDGGYVVAWSDYFNDGSGDVFMQRFDAHGLALGGEIRVNTTAVGEQSFAHVTATADGGFVVAWTDATANPNTFYMQRYDLNGTPAGGEQILNVTGDRMILHDVGSGAGDTITVAYTRFDGDDLIYRIDTLDYSGTQAGPPISVIIDQDWEGFNYPNLHHEILSNGRIAIGWTRQQDSVDGTSDVAFSIVDASGTVIADQVEIDPGNDALLSGLTLTAFTSNRFLASWVETEGDETRVMAQVYNASGNTIGSLMVVADGVDVTGSTYAALGADGRAYVGWTETVPFNTVSRMQAVASNGTLAGDSFLLSDKGHVRLETVETLADGSLLVSGTNFVFGTENIFTRRIVTDQSHPDFDDQRNVVTFAGPSAVTVDAMGGNDQVSFGAGDDIGFGNLGADTLRGNGGADFLSGGRGNDRLYGGAGADTIEGGVGNDVLRGGAASDRIWGDGGDDTLHGDIGADTLEGGDGSDTVNGGDGADTIFGDYDPDLFWLFTGGGNDSLFGGKGNDTIQGGQGDDTLDGGEGNDTLRGDYVGYAYFDPDGFPFEDGRDLFILSPGDDVMIGGGRRDTLDMSGAGIGMILVMEQGFGDKDEGELTGLGNAFVAEIEIFIGSAFGDSFTANDISTRYDFHGEGGDDVFIGAEGGSARFFGGAGRDTLSYLGAAIGATISLADPGAVGGAAIGNRFEGIENLTGTWHDDVLTGDNGANVLDGVDGTDELSGLAGDDILIGDEGAKIFRGGKGNDTASWAPVEFGGVTVDLAGLVAADGEAADDVLLGIENLTGTDQNDDLYGDDNANVLTGLDGSDDLFGRGSGDTLFGGEGGDTLYGGAGWDSLFGGGANDTLIGGGGADVLNGGAGTDAADYSASGSAVTVSLAANTGSGGNAEGDTYSLLENLIGSAFADSLTGNDQVNMLYGGDGNDTLYGGGSGDTLYGGADNDTLIGGGGNDIAYGGSGSDTLVASGDDTLHGGANSDIFVLTNFKDTVTIADFAVGDSIDLELSGFAALPLGVVASANFRSGTAPVDGDDYLIYDRFSSGSVGRLYYDADGSGTAFGAILVAVFTGSPNLLPSGIEVI